MQPNFNLNYLSSMFLDLARYDTTTTIYGNDKKGDDKIEGLLTKLSKRVGIIKQISNVVTPFQLKSISLGMFTSKMILSPVFWKYMDQ